MTVLFQETKWQQLDLSQLVDGVTPSTSGLTASGDHERFDRFLDPESLASTADFVTNMITGT